MDKMSWEDVRKEMTVDKGLDGDVADRIGEYVKLKGELFDFRDASCTMSDMRRIHLVPNLGGPELVERLLQDEKLLSNASAKAGLQDMSLLFKYLDIFGVTKRVSSQVAPVLSHSRLKLTVHHDFYRCRSICL